MGTGAQVVASMMNEVSHHGTQMGVFRNFYRLRTGASFENYACRSAGFMTGCNRPPRTRPIAESSHCPSFRYGPRSHHLCGSKQRFEHLAHFGQLIMGLKAARVG
jgi:hypothetical protein